MADSGGTPAWIKPMLASPDGGTLPTGPRYVYEYKYDGYRAQLGVAADGTVQLISRNGNDLTAEFGGLARGAATALTPVLDGRRAVFDGEIVVRDEHGRPDFSLLQHRRGGYPGRKRKPSADVPDGTMEYVVFDLLLLGDRDLLAEPYTARRSLIAEFGYTAPVSLVPAFSHEELAAQGLTPQGPARPRGRARLRGAGRQGTGQHLPPRRAHPRVAQAPADRHPGGDHLRLAAGVDRRDRPVRRPAAGRARPGDRRPGLPRRRGHRVHRARPP